MACAAIAFAEPELEKYSGDDFLAPLANHVLGSGMDKLLLIAVLTSAAACTQTTILPGVRTALSMARAGSLPKIFGEIHPRYLTPAQVADLTKVFGLKLPEHSPHAPPSS